MGSEKNALQKTYHGDYISEDGSSEVVAAIIYARHQGHRRRSFTDAGDEPLPSMSESQRNHQLRQTTKQSKDLHALYEDLEANVPVRNNWRPDIRDPTTSSCDVSEVVPPPPPLMRPSQNISSSPGAFRMSSAGVPQGRYREDEESTAISYPSRKHEYLIEAKLVMDEDGKKDEVPSTPISTITAQPLESMFCGFWGWKGKFCLGFLLFLVALLGIFVGAFLGSSSSVDTDDGMVDHLPLSETSLEVKHIPTSSPILLRIPTDTPSQQPKHYFPSLDVQQPSTVPTPLPSATPTSVPTTSPTSLPSEIPTTPDLLTLLPPETQVSLQDLQSPQSKAYQWFLNDPQLSTYPSSRKLQRFGLATFFYATQGEDWYSRQNWLSYDQHECEWFSDLPTGIVCNENDQTYLVMVLNENNLSGAIPEELWLLTSLIALGFHDDDLEGNLSPKIGQLQKLEHVALHDVGLVGSIPTEIGLVSKLDFLDLAYNAFDDTIPKEIGNLSALQSLFLEETSLQGSLPSDLGSLTKLKELYLHSNDLLGRIPSEYGNMRALQEIQLGFNGLTGSLPPELGSLSKLEVLALQSNAIEGGIPAAYDQLTSLENVFLSGNNLTGELSGSLIGEWQSVKDLSMAGNAFEGVLPLELGFLSKMELLDVAGNLFTGTIPPVLGRLENLQYLYLEDNLLQGRIPSELGSLTSLKIIWLHNNDLTGEIPPEVCDLMDNWGTFVSVDCTKITCDCGCECGFSREFSASTTDGASISSSSAWSDFMDLITGWW